MKKSLLIAVIVGLSLDANTIYVNQQNKAKDTDGKTWISAYKNLNKALKVAESGDDVWVAKGEYILKPTRVEGVNIYGGFSATETALNQRKIVNNETKLYGRLALQNALLSSVTILEEPERHRVVEIKFDKQNKGFNPNKQRMQDQRQQRQKRSAKWEREHPEQKASPNGSSDETTYKRPQRQGNNKPDERRGPPKPEELMQKFDTNNDGKISKEEAPKRMLRDWDRLDKNKDGFIEEHEIKPPKRQGEPPRK